MNSIDPIRDTIKQLMLATKVYIIARTPHLEDKKVYGLAIDNCVSILNESGTTSSVLIDRLMESKLQCSIIKNPWFSNATPRHHAEVAHDHAIDIVRSLARRFISGVSSDSKTVNRNVDAKPRIY